MDFQNDGLTITRNFISINNGNYTTKVRAISIRSSNSASTLNISNNFISLTDANATSATVGAIEFGDNTLDDPFVADIHFNTIYIGGTHTNGTSGNVLSAAFIFTKTFANHTYNISNNIVINDRVGPAGTVHAAYWIPANGTLGTRNLDYNTYNISGENFAVINTTTYNGFGNYQGAVGQNETNSNTVPVQTISNTDLHLTGTSIGNPNLAGISVPGIVNDIDGHSRGPIPYRGGDEPNAPLPIRLASFNASEKNTDVILNWTTASEINAGRFEVQRSFTPTEGFATIGSIGAKGNSTSIQHYTLADRSVTSMFSGRTLYYRLKSIDVDGRFVLSGVISIKTENVKQLASVYPNPFTSDPSIQVNTEKTGKTILMLTDITGKIILRHEIMLPAGSSLIKMPGLNLVAKGIYHLQILAEGNRTVVSLVKQ